MIRKRDVACRGNGVSARGSQGGGHLLNKRGSKSSCIQALKIIDDEDESKFEDEYDEFDSVKLVGNKKPMLSPIEKADPKTSSVKVTGDVNYLSQSRFH